MLGDLNALMILSVSLRASLAFFEAEPKERLVGRASPNWEYTFSILYSVSSPSHKPLGRPSCLAARAVACVAKQTTAIPLRNSMPLITPVASTTATCFSEVDVSRICMSMWNMAKAGNLPVSFMQGCDNTARATPLLTSCCEKSKVALSRSK